MTPVLGDAHQVRQGCLRPYPVLMMRMIDGFVPILGLLDRCRRYEKLVDHTRHPMVEDSNYQAPATPDEMLSSLVSLRDDRKGTHAPTRVGAREHAQNGHSRDEGRTHRVCRAIYSHESHTKGWRPRFLYQRRFPLSRSNLMRNVLRRRFPAKSMGTMQEQAPRETEYRIRGVYQHSIYLRNFTTFRAVRSCKSRLSIFGMPKTEASDAFPILSIHSS